MLPTKHCGKKTQSLNTKEISYAYIFEAKRHSEYIFFFSKRSNPRHGNRNKVCVPQTVYLLNLR